MTTNEHNLNDGGPAFPCEWDYINTNRSLANGMTLRDYFAVKALIVAWHAFDQGYTASDGDHDALAQHAYRIADAMLKARQS